MGDELGALVIGIDIIKSVSIKIRDGICHVVTQIGIDLLGIID